MPNPAITLENISKRYRLGMVGSGTLREDIVGWWYQVRGKEDPYSKIAEANNREQKGASNYVWALKDINFSVEQGEVLGVIGKNGAGKSTLLKLLSRVTAPTTGSIKARGRIASLLEVGTGFHPELSGRDNIFLNGAIMGMRRAEIKSKFDEIVDFAGVERYIDTPVKRYSSGMYVRLAFAVAAHLEPEILIVDEVLAVGDAQFQKKAIGKMKDVSKGQGRTVLFVSHNMKSIERLCPRSLLMEKGMVKAMGNSNSIIRQYRANDVQIESIQAYTKKRVSAPDDSICLLEGGVLEKPPYRRDDKLHVDFQVECHHKMAFHVNLHIFSNEGEMLFLSSTDRIEGNPGTQYLAKFFVPQKLFNERDYFIKMSAVKDGAKTILSAPEYAAFTVHVERDNLEYYGKRPGVLYPHIPNSITALP